MSDSDLATLVRSYLDDDEVMLLRTREMMQRMGHASMRAALIYQHATSERDRERRRSRMAGRGWCPRSACPSLLGIDGVCERLWLYG